MITAKQLYRYINSRPEKDFFMPEEFHEFILEQRSLIWNDFHFVPTFPGDGKKYITCHKT